MATAFSQRDERWSRIPLGLYGGHTIGSAGCLLTCGASILADSGLEGIDPGRLNRWLCRHGGFIRGNLIVFQALGELAQLNATVIDCANKPAPMDKVRDTLDSGGFVLAKVDFAPGGVVQQHWIRILKVVDDDAIILDPWMLAPKPYWLMPLYARYDWASPARAIFRLALYTREPSTGKSGRQASLSIREVRHD